MWGGKKFYFVDSISVGVRDIDKAIAWYQEKLGLRLTPLKSEDSSAFLAFAKDDDIGVALVAIPASETDANIEERPILFTKKIEACRQEFLSRGIQVRPLQHDSAGNSFFQFADMEGNLIEVCVEP